MDGLKEEKKNKKNFVGNEQKRMPMTMVSKSFHLLLTFPLMVFKQGWGVYTPWLFLVAQQDL